MATGTRAVEVKPAREAASLNPLITAPSCDWNSLSKPPRPSTLYIVADEQPITFLADFLNHHSHFAGDGFILYGSAPTLTIELPSILSKKLLPLKAQMDIGTLFNRAVEEATYELCYIRGYNPDLLKQTLFKALNAVAPDILEGKFEEITPEAKPSLFEAAYYWYHVSIRKMEYEEKPIREERMTSYGRGWQDESHAGDW